MDAWTARTTMPGGMPASATGTDARDARDAHAAYRRGAGPNPDQAGAGNAPEADDETPEQRQQREQQEADFRRRYRPRQCRICLDTVDPTFEAAEGMAAFLRPGARVRYVSDDPEFGKLLSPCKCKGSQRYVHEGCLRAWRESQPLRDRNFWHCPTCGFQYRMTRLTYYKWITSTGTRVVLTLAFFVLAIFVLGYVSDPILSLWTDPLGTIVDTVTFSDDSSWGAYDQYDYEPVDEMLRDFSRSWYGHFAKGFFSLGIIGFLKTMVAASPFYWINLGIGGRRRRRGRMEDVNFLFVILGVITFLGAAWKIIGYLCAKFLENVGETVMDIQPDGPDDDEDENGAPTGEAPAGDAPAGEARRDL